MLDLEISAETAAIAARLREAAVGETVSYDELSAAIGRDIRKRRHLLYAGMRAVERETGAVFGTERGVGVRRLPTDEASKIGAHARKRIRRAAHRAAGRIDRAVKRANDLPDDVARKSYGEIATLRLLEHLSSDKAQPKQEKAPDRPEPVAVTAARMFDRMSG